MDLKLPVVNRVLCCAIVLGLGVVNLQLRLTYEQQQGITVAQKSADRSGEVTVGYPLIVLTQKIGHVRSTP